MTATEAIAQSVSRNEIVHTPYDSDLADSLGLYAEDSVLNGDVWEFWGVTDSGDEWRVHLD